MYGYVGGDPVNYVDPSGLYTEIIGWTGVGVGTSSFGHISVRINDMSYSFGPKGLDIRKFVDYAQVNNFRTGKGIILNLSSAQESSLANYLSKSKGASYSAISNNCGGSIQSGLNYITNTNFNNTFPSSIISELGNSSLAIGQTYYPITSGQPIQAPSLWGNINSP